MKKKLESRLVQSVRQVKSQTKLQVQEPAVVPAGMATPRAAQGRASVADAGCAGAAAAQPPMANPVRRSDDLHPQRVWPD